MAKAAVAFLSYVRLDDQHENGRLTEFCARLSGRPCVSKPERPSIFSKTVPT